MPEPTCGYCDQKIEQKSDAVTVEKVANARFTEHEGGIDLGSYEQESIEFFHRSCWKKISDIIAEASTERER